MLVSADSPLTGVIVSINLKRIKEESWARFLVKKHKL